MQTLVRPEKEIQRLGDYICSYPLRLAIAGHLSFIRGGFVTEPPLCKGGLTIIEKAPAGAFYANIIRFALQSSEINK